MMINSVLTSRLVDAIRRAAQDTRKAILPLLGYNLIVAAVSMLVFTPLIAWLFRHFVASTGKNVLSDMEIAAFLLAPSGIIALVILLVVVLSLNIVLSAGYMQILLRQGERRPPGIIAPLLTTLNRLPGIMGLIAVMIGIALLTAAPFLLAFATFALPLIGEFDINFYLAQKPPEFWRAVVIAAGLAATLALLYLYMVIGWTLALPLLLFQGLSPVTSLRESWRLVRGRRGEIATIIIGWIVTVSLLAVVLGWLGTWFASLAVSPRESLAVTVALMGILLLWDAIVTLAVAFLALTSLSAVIVRIYLAITGETAIGTTQVAEVGAWIGKLRQLPRAAWWAATGLGIAMTTGFSWFLLHDIELDSEVLVIAHRGSSTSAPENTMAAVNLALDEGTDFVEIDVQEAADGSIVVLHDADLKRVAGLNLAIADLAPAEIPEIDIGSWFDPAFSRERLPLLTDVLEAARGRSGVTIELKYTSRADRLAKRVVDVVRQSGATDYVEYMSLNYAGTQELRRIEPAATVGFLSNISVGSLFDTNVDFLAVSGRTATRNFIGKAQDAGKRVYVWTVNKPREMALFIDRGVDGIITDTPQVAHEVMAELRELNLAERLVLRFGNEIGLEIGPSEQ